MQKILFNDTYGLTRAVLNGKKTMTRRLIPPKVVEYALNVYRQDYYSAALDYLNDKECLEGWLIVEKKSRYKLNEVVAVAQNYETLANSGHLDQMTVPANNPVQLEFKKEYTGKGWSNKLFVRADLMPHQIKITGIRIEGIQDISDEDCLKEGIEYSKYERNWFYTNDKNTEFHAPSPREAFASLISRPGVGRKWLWEQNPWVICYTFKLVK